MGVRLPPEYQEVEYLESDENQRIVLNIKPSITDVITIKYKLTNIEYNTGIYGCASEPVYFGIGTNANFANYYAQIGGRAYKQSSVPKDTNIHTHVLDMPRLIYSVDGIETSLAGLTPNPNTNTGYGLWFHHGAHGSYLRYTAGRIYFFDIKDRITLVPCYRKSDDKPGMYDLVSGTFFTNVGTGEFIVGSDVIDSISPWLVARRRVLMQQEPELYPVGTDVIALYAHNWVDDSSWTNTGGTSSISGAARCTNYIPIDPRYTYRKNNYRLYNYCCWYDADKHFIQSFALNNTTAQDITNIPQNARYMRVSTYKANKAQLKVIRTA